MLPLRYPWIWLTIGWGLVLGVTVGSLLPGNVIRGFAASDKFVHAMSYCLLMIWFGGLYTRRRYGLVAGTLLALGVIIEFAQVRLSYRMFDPIDMLANAGGILVGLALSLSLLAGWCQRVEKRLGYHD